MQEFAKDIYGGDRWKECRKAYKKSVGGLCENCLKKGIYRPAVIIHHVIPISIENRDDPNIVYNFENLEALCRECHGERHGKKERRYKVNKTTGEIKAY